MQQHKEVASPLPHLFTSRHRPQRRLTKEVNFGTLFSLRIGHDRFKRQMAVGHGKRYVRAAVTRSRNLPLSRSAMPAEWPNVTEAIFCAAGVLSATPLTDSLHRYDSVFVVFCFAKSKEAEAYAKRFGGRRLPTT
jgi:hypothetical protein